MHNIIHVTHEAVQKIGGIGAVLEGLLTARSYQSAVPRSLLLGPLFWPEGPADLRLGRGGEIFYSSLDGRTDHPSAAALREVEERFGVRLVYGRRPMRAPDTGAACSPEVLLVDIRHVHAHPLRELKFRLFESFGIASDRYEGVWDYEQYMRLAMPGLAAARAIGVCGDGRAALVVAHEYMGMPTALAALLHPEFNCRAVFHAHEVAAVRKIVEEHPGHDTMFYNAMRHAREQGRCLEDVFGSQAGYYKHPLVAASRFCQGIWAVGDPVVEEMRFLGPEFRDAPIRLVYNGVPTRQASIADEDRSKHRLQEYAEALLGDRPQYVFTHVTRLVRSKGLWRDLQVLEHVDRQFRRDGRTAVLFVLSTEIGGPRRPEDIRRMEREWGWPLAHRDGHPDLSHGEAVFYQGVQAFNARARQVKVVFINQFGFDREHCGERMPAEMEFWDIRRGSDLEFGQSVYEPFGIAQLEALSFGSLCVMTNVCGCAGFVNRVTGGQPEPNVVIADYTRWPLEVAEPKDWLRLTEAYRLELEGETSRRVADRVLALLPKSPNDEEVLLDRGHEIAARMSWDVIATDYFLPAVRDAMARDPGPRR